jgi:hypothetical protein
MEENRIGVPTLAKRITDANPEQEIQITTLQRFLTGHARTNEDSVGAIPSLRRQLCVMEAGLAK